MNTVFFLVLIIIGGGGITSQSIPMQTLAECTAIASKFNNGQANKNIVANTYNSGARTQKAYCIKGVK